MHFKSLTVFLMKPHEADPLHLLNQLHERVTQLFLSSKIIQAPQLQLKSTFLILGLSYFNSEITFKTKLNHKPLSN